MDLRCVCPQISFFLGKTTSICLSFPFILSIIFAFYPPFFFAAPHIHSFGLLPWMNAQCYFYIYLRYCDSQATVSFSRRVQTSLLLNILHYFKDFVFNGEFLLYSIFCFLAFILLKPHFPVPR